MELHSPITVHWDIPADGTTDAFIRSTGEQIAACRPLTVQITLREWPTGEAFLTTLEMLSSSSVSLSLTVPAAEYTTANAKLPAKGHHLKELLLSFGNMHELETHSDLLRLEAERLSGGTAFGISVTVSNDNWRDLPKFVSFCRAHGIRRLALPMQRLFNGEAPFFIGRAEQGQLGAHLEAAGGVGDLRLTIHDPFLWHAFNPGLPFPQSGCQAANSMIAIAADGRVYPCPSLPHEIGRLGVQTLGEIIASPEKKEIRSRIRANPSGCYECPELAACRGGCRGRGLAIHGSFDGIDTACRYQAINHRIYPCNDI